MFDKDFYPTPKGVINKMLMEISVQGKTVLEPSAGKGNIVDVLNQRGAGRVLTYEKTEVWADHLQTKSEFLGYDFLQCRSQEISHIDYIVMNPPFSRVEDHILHAWKVAPEGCQIIALCPTNRFSRGHIGRRDELKTLLKDHGYGKTDLGDCFSTAERKTNVEVSMIQFLKPIRSENFDYEGFYMDMPEGLEYPEGVIKYDFVRSIVSRYVTAMKIFERAPELVKELDAAIKPLGFNRDTKIQIGYDKTIRTKEQFSRILQKTCWNQIFAELNMEKYVTSGVKEKINRFREKRREYPFTRANIYRMLEIIIGTQESIMNEALEEAFDKITKHYHDNRYNVEGWKTNSHYLVKQKIILPNVVKETWRNDDSRVTWNWISKVDDLHKGLAHIAGRHKDLGSIKDLGDIERGTWYDWGFFEVKGHYCGTLHMRFKDEKVWELFNRRVAEIKGHPLPEKVDIAA